MGTNDHNDENEEVHYKRKNSMQVTKVRCFVRESKYLAEPKQIKEHLDMSKNNLSKELIIFPSIAENNIKQYVQAKLNNTHIKIVPVYATQQEIDEAGKIENKTITELQVLIYRTIDIFDPQNQKLQEDIFEKSVKNQNKCKYIEFLTKLYEVSETSVSDENTSEDIGMNK